MSQTGAWKGQCRMQLSSYGSATVHCLVANHLPKSSWYSQDPLHVLSVSSTTAGAAVSSSFDQPGGAPAPAPGGLLNGGSINTQTPSITFQASIDAQLPPPPRAGAIPQAQAARRSCPPCTTLFSLVRVKSQVHSCGRCQHDQRCTSGLRTSAVDHRECVCPRGQNRSPAHSLLLGA